jgi:hypothetical protein
MRHQRRFQYKRMTTSRRSGETPALPSAQRIAHRPADESLGLAENAIDCVDAHPVDTGDLGSRTSSGRRMRANCELGISGRHPLLELTAVSISSS